MDRSELQGRLRRPESRRTQPSHRTMDGFRQQPVFIPRVASPTKSRPKTTHLPVKAQSALDVISPQPFAHPARPKLQQSSVLKRQAVRLPIQPQTFAFPLKSNFAKSPKYSRLQIALVGMACFVFLSGVAVSLLTLRTNHAAAQQVQALSKHADDQTGTDTGSNNSSAPSTTKPSARAFSQYAVAPDLPRYLKIPKLGVNARVLQAGIKNNGELATPNNVYDAAWYTGSAKPGQPGATLIDGHVSSWTTHGVFFAIKKLAAGDAIQIVRGDGTMVNYRVVKSQTYDANHVDMQAAVTTVTKGKSGLNLITCGGKVKPGTNEFTQRVIVFAEQQG